MTAADTEAPAPAAYLAFRITSRPDDEEHYAIYPNDEFDIGRTLVHETLGVEDRSISTHHLRIRCIVYEDDDEHRVEPLIYMRMLSNNPVILRRNGLDGPDGGLDVDKHFPDILLNDGDQVQLTHHISFEFRTVAHADSNPPRLDRTKVAEIKRFSDRYRLSNRVLGVGGYAAVYVAVKQPSGQQLACKVVSLPTRSEDDEPADLRRRRDNELAKKRITVAREYDVLKSLSHPNIITLEKVFRTPHNVYIFQELITGGDLLSYLDKKGRLSEPQAVVIVRQLLEAVKYLHSNQVVHRDIKPENILMTSWRDGARVILTDFGQSRTIVDLEQAAKKAGVLRMQSVVGTYGYVAPEVYHRTRQNLQDGSGYSQAIDIWSIGCVTATLFTNDFIFPDGKELQVDNITMSQFNRCLDVLDSGEEWAHVSHRAKAFLRGSLATDEELRLTAVECLALPWFQHPSYRAEFDALYKRAIKDWKPRVPDEEVIEFIDTSNISPPGQAAENIRSHHLPVQKPPNSTPSRTTHVQSDSRGTLRCSSADDESEVSPGMPNASPADPSDDFSPIPDPPMLDSRSFAAAQQRLMYDSLAGTQSLPAPPNIHNQHFLTFDNTTDFPR